MLTWRLTSTVPAAAPPIRKNTSCSAVGSAASPLCAFFGPTWSSTGEFRRPASKIRPEMSTPGTSATLMVTLPRVGVSVGKPSPRTTLSARLTVRVLPTW
ncbi:MAG TPA: hypothetical protein VMT69_05550 [Kineosporiaceae bacterium]|nr:hypothetical protein [Kineosporiaceae bacterium]